MTSISKPLSIIKQEFTQITGLPAIAVNGRKYITEKKDFRKKDTWLLVLSKAKENSISDIKLSELLEFIKIIYQDVWEDVNNNTPEVLYKEYVKIYMIGAFAFQHDNHKIPQSTLNLLTPAKLELVHKAQQYFIKLKSIVEKHCDTSILPFDEKYTLIKNRNFGQVYNQIVYRDYAYFVLLTGLYINDLNEKPYSAREIYVLRNSLSRSTDYVWGDYRRVLTEHPPSTSIQEAYQKAKECCYMSIEYGESPFLITYADRTHEINPVLLLSSFVSNFNEKGWRYIKGVRGFIDYKEILLILRYKDILPDEYVWEQMYQLEQVVGTNNLKEVLLYCEEPFIEKEERIIDEFVEFYLQEVKPAYLKYREKEVIEEFRKDLEFSFNQCDSLQELKSARKKLAMKYHPDKGGSTELMQIVNDTYDLYCSTLQDNIKYQTAYA